MKKYKFCGLLELFTRRRAAKGLLRAFICSALSSVLSIALINSVAVSRDTRAQDAQTIGMVVGVLGGGMILLSGVDSIKSAQDCATLSFSQNLPWEKCAMLGVGVAGVVAGIATMMSGTEEAGAVRGSGSGRSNNYDQTFDPNKPLAPQICQGDTSQSPACDCSGPNASVNILCGPDSIKNVKKILDDSRQKFADGGLALPEGMTADEFNSQNANASSLLDDLLAGNLGKVDSTNLGEALGTGKSGGLGAVGSDIIGGGSDPLAAKTKTKAGPADRTGLGKISLANGLDSIDEATGKLLTLWQRNTRRHQGNERGVRAFFMAKVEFMRKRSMAPATLASATAAKPTDTKVKSPSLKQKNPGPSPKRQPASLPQKLRGKN